MSFNYEDPWMRVDAKVKSLIPTVQELRLSELELPSDHPNPFFSQFFETLIRGRELLQKRENLSSYNLFHRWSYTSQILRLEGEIQVFMDLIMPTQILLQYRRLQQDMQDYHHEAQLGNMSRMPGDMSRTPEELFENREIREGFNDSLPHIAPVERQSCVGLDTPIGDLKRALFQNEVSVVGVHCSGGGGKTFLALFLCNDDDIKGYFQNVVFLTVSQSPNVKGIIEMMWDKIVRKKRPGFQNVEDAHRQLQQQLQCQSESTLVILDDVWSKANLEALLFERAGYKTIVTTRDSSTVPRNHFTQLYQLPLLGHEDAQSLFCFWAFGETSIPTNLDANLVKEVIAECGGWPLALKVIATCLKGQPPVEWKIAKDKLSRGKWISDYHRDNLLECMENSVSFLNDVARECFLDLAAFPADKEICADALLDIWVYFRRLEWHEAFHILWDLASRNLLTLTSNSRSPAAISHGCPSELYFSQQNIMRDLALHLGSKGSELLKRRRLIMPRKENNLPREWELLKHTQSDAQIVSIHTGPMGTREWYEINFPKTEALVIFFAASEYHLPPFIKSMQNLKFLMICNYSSERATVQGLDVLTSLPQLRSVRLERLVAPNIQKQSNAPRNLEKLSLSFCEGFGIVSIFNCSELKDFNLDHSCDLQELPPAICRMPSALTWSITNCHLVQKIPFDHGNQSSIRVLRLSALPGLKELPASIGKLGQLEYLDISGCESLTKLPDEIGDLVKLEEFDMRVCPHLKMLPQSFRGLRSLKRVICEEQIKKQWLWFKKNCFPELILEVMEAQSSLNSLDF